MGAEYLPPSLRSSLRDRGIRVSQTYASADLGLIAYESVTADGTVNDSMILDERLILEIVRPGTGNPVALGEVGEVVITTFNRITPPHPLRHRRPFGCLPARAPAERTNVRIKGWMGRADQSTKVRGMFVAPPGQRHRAAAPRDSARAPGGRRRSRRRPHDAQVRDARAASRASPKRSSPRSAR